MTKCQRCDADILSTSQPAYSAWLIEVSEPEGPEYFQLVDDDNWSSDHDSALHFARKQDAEKYIADVGWTRARVVEHMWPSAQPNRMGTTPEMQKMYDQFGEPCPYCSDGKRTGLPGNACENCMNTGLKYPERALAATPAVGGEAILARCDELHDLGFNAGWNGAIDECAKLVEGTGLRNPTNIARNIRALAALPASPLRDLDIPITIDCYEPLTLREIIVAYFMADSRPYDGLGKRHADRYLAALASPPEQSAANPASDQVGGTLS